VKETTVSQELNLSAHEVLTTTRSVRKRLDFDRPVARSVVLECIDVALQAPTGSNHQGWQWMVVEDEAKKQAVAELYARNFFRYIDQAPRQYPDGDSRAERRDLVRSSAVHLAENFHRSPFLVIPLIEGRLGEGLDTFAQASSWGSILPAVWSFMLALRDRSLGSAWTTLHLPDEQAAAEILDIPYDRYTQAGLFPVAYTLGTDFKPANRMPAAELTHWDTFGHH
jgi:nitroreductase